MAEEALHQAKVGDRLNRFCVLHVQVHEQNPARGFSDNDDKTIIAAEVQCEPGRTRGGISAKIYVKIGKGVNQK